MKVKGMVLEARIQEFVRKSGERGREVRIEAKDETAGILTLTKADDGRPLPQQGDLIEAAVSHVRTITGQRGGFTMFIIEDWHTAGRYVLEQPTTAKA